MVFLNITMVETNEDGRSFSSFQDLLYNTDAGRLITLGAVVVGLVLGYSAIDSYLVKHPVEQRQAIGNEKPDVFIEKDGVLYFSQVDGKNISDLVKE